MRANFALAADRYAAMLKDGQRVAANEIAAWQDPAQQPSIAGKPLFDAGNPVRWIVDTSRPLPSLPPAYVELFGGDRIPGEVAAFRGGSELPVEQSPPHLVVQCDAALAPFDSAGRDVVRVATEWVQRVVWQGNAGRELRPGTAFLRDGRALPFRSLRWGESSVSLLTDQGVVSLPFLDLAEVHAGRRNGWDAWFDQLALLTPSGSGTLIHAETLEGARLTTSSERLRPAFRGDRNKPESWVHVMQPAWALDPLWVRFSGVVRWRFFAPHQAPLSIAQPSEVKQESIFAVGTKWQLDRSVAGQSLRTSGLDFGWGFGVPARNELTFELPAAARSFRTSLGLDDSSGDGGCARGVVMLDTGERRTIYQGEVLVGSKKALDSGVLSIPASTAAKLILVADPVLEGRPTGADPFDIRDAFNWLNPELELDPEAVIAEIGKRAVARIAAFDDWTISPADASKCRLVNHWDESNPRDARFRPLLAADGPFVAMSRRMRIERGHKWIALSVTRPPTQTTPVRVQVRIDGAALAEFDVPAHASPMPPDPVLLPIGDHQETTATVEVIPMSEKPDGAVDWRAFALVDRWPGLLRVFEDEPEFARDLQDGTGTADVVAENPYKGKASLRVTPLERGNVRMAGLNVPIREYPEFGEYRYLRFAWRMEGSSQISLSLGHSGEFGGASDRTKGRPRPQFRGFFFRPRRGVAMDERGLAVGYRYDAGKGPPPAGGAIRLGGPESKWVEVTRDLFADFGNFTLTGMQFGCADGTAAGFDHISLGRTVQDLDSTREPASAAVAAPGAPRQILDRNHFGQLLKQVAPLFSTSASGDGLTLLPEHLGRKNVLRTFGPDNKTPCVLRAAVAVPAGKQTVLELSAGHTPKEDWPLAVTANGQTIHDGIVGESTAKEGWLDLSIDLSRFAGQNVVLTVEHRAAGEKRHHAFWSRLAIVTK